jgi:hypothetical protein
MGVRHTFGTAGATGGGFSAQPGSLQPHFEERTGEPKWCYQRRSFKTRRDPVCWIGGWSFGCRVSGGLGAGQDGEAPIGRGIGSADYYEPTILGDGGSQNQKFVQGLVVDSVGAVVPGATVQGFVTSTDIYTGDAQSCADGSYAVPTQNPGVAHYMVAYIPGSPDRGGTTVNTLVPANLDGS